MNMTTYKNPRAQSVTSTAASILQAELTDFGVTFNHEDYFELQRLVAKYGLPEVRTITMKTLDRYTKGVDGTHAKTAEEYIMDRLKQHNWNRNNHK